MIRVQAWNEFVSPKFYGPLAIWPCLKISPQSSLNVIYCLIITAWQLLMSFPCTPCIPMQIKSNKSPLRNRLLALLLWEFGHLSSSSRSRLGRLILIYGNQGALRAEPPHPHRWEICGDGVEQSLSHSTKGEMEIIRGEGLAPLTDHAQETQHFSKVGSIILGLFKF